MVKTLLFTVFTFLILLSSEISADEIKEASTWKSARKAWEKAKQEPKLVIKKKILTQSGSPNIIIEEIIEAKLKGKKVILEGRPEALTFHEKNQLNKRIRQCAEIAKAVLDQSDIETLDELGKDEKHFFYKKEYMTQLLLDYNIIDLYLKKAKTKTARKQIKRKYKDFQNSLKAYPSMIDKLSFLFDYYKFVL